MHSATFMSVICMLWISVHHTIGTVTKVVKIMDGQSGTLICDAKPKKWMRHDKKLKRVEGSIEINNRAKKLTFLKVGSGDSGFYKCVDKRDKVITEFQVDIDIAIEAITKYTGKINDEMKRALENISGGDTTISVGYTDSVKKCQASRACEDALDMSVPYMERIVGALGAGSAVFSALQSFMVADDAKAIALLAGKLSALLQGPAAIVSLIAMYGNSATDQLIENLAKATSLGLNKLNKKMNSIVVEISSAAEDIKAELWWQNSVKPLFDVVTVTKTMVSQYYEAPSNASRGRVERKYDDLYSTFYKSAGLWNTSMSVVTNDVCHELIRLTKAHRRQINRINSEIYNAMITGAQHLLLSSELRNFDTTYMEGQILEVLTSVKLQIEKCDSDMEHTVWKDKSMEEITNKLELFPNAASQEEITTLTKNVSDDLQTKYYWRDWFVAIYREHATEHVTHESYRICGELIYNKTDDGNRILVTSSRKQENPQQIQFTRELFDRDHSIITGHGKRLVTPDEYIERLPDYVKKSCRSKIIVCLLIEIPYLFKSYKAPYSALPDTGKRNFRHEFRETMSTFAANQRYYIMITLG